MADGVWKGVYLLVFGWFHELSLNKFFDLSTPYMKSLRRMFSAVICCSGGIYAVQEGYMDAQEGCILFRGVIYCSGGLYRCSGGLYTVQEGYMLFRGVICCLGGLYAVQEGYMIKKIMMILVATNVIAS